MKGVTVYYEKGRTAFSIWQDKLNNVMSTDSKSNRLVWFSKCLICQDYVVCGLDTKRETLEYTRSHMEEYHQ